MAHISTISESAPSGLLAEIYAAARKRAGKVYQILKVQSLNPPVLQAMIDLYRTTMFGASPLSRARREMLAVVVSTANECFY